MFKTAKRIQFNSADGFFSMYITGRPMNDSEEDSYYSDEENGMMDVDNLNGPSTDYYDEEEEDEDREQDRRREREGMHRQSGPATAAAAARGLAPNSNNAPSAAEQTIEQRFKIRDGEMDVDSKLGRIYRADAKTFFKSIPDKADQKAAKAAFNLWDSCAENAWDRHRWDRPSKTQNDEPHVLGQLNKLFDLAKKYNHDLGFPFPKWVPGGGTEAFQAIKRAAVPTAAVQQQQQEQQQPPQKLKTTAAKPTTRPAEEKSTKERIGTRSLPLLPRNRMLDDGGRGKHSDEEESDGNDENGGFVVPDGPVDDSESEEEEEEEEAQEEDREVQVIDLVGTGNNGGSGSNKKSNPFMLPESQSPVHPGAGARQKNVNNSNNRVLIADSDDDDDEDKDFEAMPGIGANETFSHKDASAAAVREIARLSAWNWDSRKEEHPPNAAVYGLADGKRSRRQRFTASQIVDVLGASEEQQEQLRLKKPRRRSRPADGEISGEEAEEEEEEEEMQRQRQPVAYDSSSSDDDVPLAAQFSRYRTTPGSNEPAIDRAAGTANKIMTTPPLEAVVAAVDGAPSTSAHGYGINNTAGVSEQNAITPNKRSATREVVSTPPSALPPDPSSAERAAALARALLGTLYKPNDIAEEQQEVNMPGLTLITRQENHTSAAVPPAAETGPAANPSSSVSQIGIVPDSQEDEDILLFN
jgi:hypothetical protein